MGKPNENAPPVEQRAASKKELEAAATKHFSNIIDALSAGRTVTFKKGFVTNGKKMIGTMVHFTNGEKRKLYTLRKIAVGATIS